MEKGGDEQHKTENVSKVKEENGRSGRIKKIIEEK